MRRQDLITALVRHPDHPVTVDGLAVTGVTVTSVGVALHVAKLAGPAADQGALDDLRTSHAADLARVREEDRRAADAEIAVVRESGARELAAEQGRAAAELAEVRAGHDADKARAVEEAVAAALATERAGKADA